MRLRNLGFFGAGAMLFAGAAIAQNVPEQFVVSGKAAEKLQDFTTINLATAERIANSCVKAATAENVGISIMVLVTTATKSTWIAWMARAISASSRPR